jgi:hypothetical protein
MGGAPDGVENAQSGESIVMFDLAAPVVPAPQVADVFSNENVIIYPLDADMSAPIREFPKYRGVMDNTTAGGYTVFDQSVSVFPVDGHGIRPNYLPEYAIPKYVNHVESSLVGVRELTPMMGQATPLLRAPIPTRPSVTPVGRRSGRVLTSYE